MRTSVLYLIIFTFLITSCKKEAEVMENTASLDYLTLGDYSDLTLNYYDTILIGGYHNTKSINLDIDKDGLFDIRLISDIWGSPGIGQHPCSKIKCLNSNVQLSGAYRNDTSFLNQNTQVLSGSNNTIEIYKYYNYSCHRITVNDSILGITFNKFKLFAWNKSDVIQKFDTYKSDSITLVDDWYGYPAQTIHGYGVDTIAYKISTFYNDCNNFPIDAVKYIGIKTNKNNIQKIGWIKLSIIDKYKIFVMETAIQK
ncbi:MAG: hypothetical protein ACOYO1_15085 [Bacteroidales bacterium]